LQQRINPLVKLNTYIVDLLEPQRLRLGVTALLAVCLGLIVWSMVPRKGKAAPVAAQAVTMPSRLSAGSAAENIATAHLFGLDPTTKNAGVSPVVPAPSITV